ncbi:hypothetical protein ACY12_002837 [Salmonella enterica subsp. enterica serovar Portland]|nr:hypothetical protein [Salmonella enterica subsp. enterica serovar Dortmund]ECE0501790.1 hypothetical protein [Salmonella enterica subsp. enterica]EDS6038114.1 hypothetical protein [Salmonella enterica subsp. enterica serovar Lexington]EEB9695541.1 hypothetical protein [Salmonella enterica subsp. enterica serovar Miami]EEJ7233842.1 hypothetical protein [Salmonella enterica subsp. salamae]EGZ4348816.1 hypothetical protein [Salmonella enterica subsp. enterica serovar Portland]
MKHLRLLLYYAKKRVTMHPTYQSDVCLPTTPYLADIAGWRRERALSGLQYHTQARYALQ